jgi:hypothetical protein
MNNLKSQIGINDYAVELDNGNWTVCKQIISNAAEEEGRREMSEWFDKECDEATLKNLAYKEMIQRHYARKAVEHYKQLRREEKKFIRRIRGHFRKKF